MTRQSKPATNYDFAKKKGKAGCLAKMQRAMIFCVRVRLYLRRLSRVHEFSRVSGLIPIFQIHRIDMKSDRESQPL
jgi:hypothetical protein